MNTRSIAQSTILLALSLVAASCIQIKDIEKAWNNAKPDEALVGNWTGANDAMVGFAKTDRDFLVTSGTNGLEGGCKSIESNGHKFVMVAKLKASLLGFGNIDADSKSGTLLRYTIDGDTLKMYSYDADQLKTAVKEGKVKGVIDENDSAEVSELDEATIKWLGQAAEGPGWSEQTYKKAK